MALSLLILEQVNLFCKSVTFLLAAIERGCTRVVCLYMIEFCSCLLKCLHA